MRLFCRIHKSSEGPLFGTTYADEMIAGFPIVLLFLPMVCTMDYRTYDIDIDYYQILNVKRSAKVSTIRASYRKLAVKLHPDTSGCDTTKQFQILGEAKDILTSKEDRQWYTMLNPGAGHWEKPYEWDMADCEMKNATLLWKLYMKARHAFKEFIELLKDSCRFQIPSFASYKALYISILTDYCVIGVVFVSSATLWCRDIIGQYLAAVCCSFYGFRLLQVAFSCKDLFLMEIIRKLILHLLQGPSLRATVLEDDFILHTYVYVVLSLAAVALVFNYIRPSYVTRFSNTLWTVITVIGCLTVIVGVFDTDMYLGVNTPPFPSLIVTIVISGGLNYLTSFIYVKKEKL
ncbi:uncharacterized protein [Argopecten irradians]|uniref:uncharacterized protein n=1 Tax=Argopecten irradians TaxID=31199 RepID=UPI0037154BEC